MESGKVRPALNGLVNAVPVTIGGERWEVYVIGLTVSDANWLIHTVVVGPHTRTFMIPVPRTLTLRAMARAILDSVVDRMVDARAVIAARSAPR
jgi:hypothetical protein